MDRVVGALEHYQEPIVVQAVMGAGKSIFLAELAAQWLKGSRVVIATSSIALVDQLHATVSRRLGSLWSVGRYYTHAKDHDAEVIIACYDSLDALASALDGEAVGLLICDEAHKTECATMHAAIPLLEAHRMVGLTATPWRSGEDQGLTLFDRMVYAYTAQDALREGVVVPWKVIHWEGKELPIDQVCVEMIRAHVAVGAGCVNAMDVADCERFASMLEEAGIKSSCVHYRLSKAERTKRLEDWRQGHVQVMVHVNLLTEGFDFPQLAFMCLRRPSSNRVRFAQEVGRALRSAPGKSCALMLDPHDLFAEFALTYDAVLAGDVEALREEEKLPAEERALLALLGCEELIGATKDKDTGRVVKPRSSLAKVSADGMKPVAQYVRRLHLACSAVGYIEQNVTGRSWRSKPPTSSQLTTASKMLWTVRPSVVQGIPKAHRKSLRITLAVVDQLNRGLVSQLLDLLFTFANVRAWPELHPVMAEALDTELEPSEQPEPLPGRKKRAVARNLSLFDVGAAR